MGLLLNDKNSCYITRHLLAPVVVHPENELFSLKLCSPGAEKRSSVFIPAFEVPKFHFFEVWSEVWKLLLVLMVALLV